MQVAYSNPTNNFNNHKNVNFGARFLETETLSKLLGKLDLTSKSMNYVDSFTKIFPDAVIEVKDCSKYIGNNEVYNLLSTKLFNSATNKSLKLDLYDYDLVGFKFDDFMKKLLGLAEKNDPFWAATTELTTKDKIFNKLVGK